jgi:hypothetical protein
LSETVFWLSEVLMTWNLPLGLGHKKRVSYFHRTAQPLTLAPFPAWGIQQELVVKDLPTAKLAIIFILQLKIQNL